MTVHMLAQMTMHGRIILVRRVGEAGWRVACQARAGVWAQTNDNDYCHRTVAKVGHSEAVTAPAIDSMINRQSRLARQMFYQALVLVGLGVGVFAFVAVLPFLLR